MMRRCWAVLSMLVVITGLALTPTPLSLAAPKPPPGPDRFTVITVDYTAYTWWMAEWGTNRVVCSLVVDHEGLPRWGEVYRDCGETIYNKWIKQPPCDNLTGEGCKGYYLLPVSSEPASKQIPAELPAATAWLSLENCNPVPSAATNVCEQLPVLVVRGQEPLPNERIIRVEGTLNKEPFACEGEVCKIPLLPTEVSGVPIEFWVYSSYGDSSVVLKGQVRVVQANLGDPDHVYWYVDVLSPQWQGAAVATCADSWEVFPPVGGLPAWLSTPPSSADLTSDIPYTYLAANLIRQGVVDASSCPDGGISPDGGANPCGLEMARPAVIEWQNRFDGLIFNTAQETGVPARLLKNLFARESQFWPGISHNIGDIGLGQLTENGADTTLLWNPSFYAQFCPLVFPSETCGKGYLHLKPNERQHLRQALIRSVNAVCEDCPLGIDLNQADFSVRVFAHTLLANCEQTGRVVRNLTKKAPGASATYEDLWKFTLLNYNAGPGCLADALTAASAQKKTFTWENVAPFLPAACQGAVDYVNDIAK